MSESLSTKPLSETYTKPEVPTATQQHQEGQSMQKTREALDKLEEDFSATTREAVAEGKADVQQTSSTYLEQAISMADKGLSSAQTYLQMGKERLTSPTRDGEAATGFTATLAATAASALDAANHGLDIAHQTLQNRSPHLQQQHPATAVTVHTKSMGDALSDNATAAKEVVLPQVEATKAVVQPHVDAAQATVQPHIDSAAAAVKPHVDAAAATAKPYVDSAAATAQPYIDSAKQTTMPYIDTAASGVEAQVEAVKAAASSDKPLSQQASEAASAAGGAARGALNSVTTTAEAKKVDGAAI